MYVVGDYNLRVLDSDPVMLSNTAAIVPDANVFVREALATHIHTVYNTSPFSSSYGRINPKS